MPEIFEIDMSLVLALVITVLLMVALVLWRRSGSWVKNMVFTFASLAIVSVWIVIIYAIIHFGPALAK